MIILGFVAVNYKLYRFTTVAPFIVFLIFLYGFILSFFNTVEPELAVQFFLSVFVLFLIYPIVRYDVDLDKIAKISGVIMAIYTIISFFIITVYMDLPFSSSFNEGIFVQYSAGANGLREFAEEGTTSFHIGTLPFMYLSFVLYVSSFIEKKTFWKFLVLILLFWVIFMSASRGTILITVLAATLVIFYKVSMRTKIIFLAVMIPVISAVLVYLINYTTVFDSGEDSNSVKLGHFQGFVNHLNFFNFFLGEGLASKYYSYGTQKITAHTEITPIDMIRYFGFILTPLLYFFIFFPSRKLSNYLGENKIYFLIFLIYVINSFTNPTMFNSYGLLVVLWYWSKVLKEPFGNDKVVINHV